MKNIKKTIILSLMTAIFICMSFVGCGTEVVKGDKVATGFYNMFVKQDLSYIKEIGMSDEDGQKAIENYKNEIKRQTKLNFTKNALTISDADLDRIVNAELDLFKKLDAEITIVSEDKNSCEVKISTTYADVTTLDTNAANDAVNEVLAMNMKSQKEANDKLVSIYIDKLVSALQNAQPSTERNEKTFTFKKEKLDCDGKVKDVYTPEDYSSFGETVGNMVTSAQK